VSVHFLEFMEQATLAETGVGDDADASECGARTKEPLEAVSQHRELGLAADHPRLDVFDAAGGDAERSRLHAAHQVRDDRLLQALDVQRRLRVHVEDAADVEVRAVADPQRSRRRGLLHPGGNVDGVSTNRRLGVDAAAEKDGAGVHADSNVEARQPMPRLDFACHGAGFVENCEPASDRALCVVLLHRLDAERGEHAVSGVLQDFSEVRIDDCGEAKKSSVDQRAQLLRIQLAAELGGPDEIHEEDADLLDDLLVRRRNVLQGAQSSADRTDDRFEDRFAQQEALRLQERERSLQSLLLF